MTTFISLDSSKYHLIVYCYWAIPRNVRDILKNIFLYKYPKNGLISSSSISHESFHCALSGQCNAFNKNDEWLKILGRTSPFVRDTFSVLYKCHYSSQYLQSFINIFIHSSFLVKAIHCLDSTQWKLSRDTLLDDINPFLGYL